MLSGVIYGKRLLSDTSRCQTFHLAENVLAIAGVGLCLLLKQLLWGNKVAGKPSKEPFYEICQWFEWFLQSPSSIQAIH